MALGHVDAEGDINALDASLGEEERICVKYYEHCRQSLLASHDWGFATKQVALTLTSLTPVDTRWAYAYQYPSDCVRFTRVINTADADDKVKFVVTRDATEGKVILTNTEDALGEYVIDISDASEFDPLFVETLSWWLAFHIATPLTGSADKRNTAMRTYLQVTPAASAKDANEAEDQRDDAASWIEARA